MGRVLIVDADEDMRDLLAIVMESEGHSVTVAGSLDQFFAAAKRGGYALCLLDVRGFGRRAAELAGVLRQELSGTSLILTTVDPDHVQFRTHDADGLVVKPFELDELRRLTRRVLGSVD